MLLPRSESLLTSYSVIIINLVPLLISRVQDYELQMVQPQGHQLLSSTSAPTTDDLLAVQVTSPTCIVIAPPQDAPGAFSTPQPYHPCRLVTPLEVLTPTQVWGCLRRQSPSLVNDLPLLTRQGLNVETKKKITIK